MNNRDRSLLAIGMLILLVSVPIVGAASASSGTYAPTPTIPVVKCYLPAVFLPALYWYPITATMTPVPSSTPMICPTATAIATASNTPTSSTTPTPSLTPLTPYPRASDTLRPRI